MFKFAKIHVHAMPQEGYELLRSDHAAEAIHYALPSHPVTFGQMSRAVKFAYGSIDLGTRVRALYRLVRSGAVTLL